MIGRRVGRVGRYIVSSAKFHAEVHPGDRQDGGGRCNQTSLMQAISLKARGTGQALAALAGWLAIDLEALELRPKQSKDGAEEVRVRSLYP